MDTQTRSHPLDSPVVLGTGSFGGLGVSATALALSWVLAQPGVRPIVGPSKTSHLDAVDEALGIELSDDDLRMMGDW